jgi:hypothetical protein
MASASTPRPRLGSGEASEALTIACDPGGIGSALVSFVGAEPCGATPGLRAISRRGRRNGRASELRRLRTECRRPNGGATVGCLDYALNFRLGR